VRALLTGLCLTALSLSALRCDCGGAVVDDEDAGLARADAASDAGTATIDGAVADVVLMDAESTDAGGADAGAPDSGMPDVGLPDTGMPDVGMTDAGMADAGTTDAGMTDTGTTDAGMTDAGMTDAGGEDGGRTIPDCSAGGLCVQLTWDTPTGDLDLHLSVNGGDYCTDEACYWANCQDGLADGLWLEWDGVLGRSAGDPVIYAEELYGLGPEVLHVETPLVAVYTVGVYFNPFPDIDPAAVRVEVFSDGVSLGSAIRTLAPNQFWEVGEVEVAADQVTFEEKPRLCAPSDWICTNAVGACPEAS